MHSSASWYLLACCCRSLALSVAASLVSCIAQERGEGLGWKTGCLLLFVGSTARATWALTKRKNLDQGAYSSQQRPRALLVARLRHSGKCSVVDACKGRGALCGPC